MIVEFNGLPGTGKTTICKELREKYKIEGINCIYRYEIQETRVKRWLSYVIDGSIHLFWLGIFFVLRDIKGGIKERWKIIFVLIAYYRMYYYYLKDNRSEILIVDQGILQALISIAHLDEIVSGIELKRIFMFLKKKNIFFTSIDCITDINVSFERIHNRKQIGSRLDICTDDELLLGLNIQSRNFEVVRACYLDVYTEKFQMSVDTKMSSEKNAFFIKKSLEQRKMGETYN